MTVARLRRKLERYDINEVAREMGEEVDAIKYYDDIKAYAMRLLERDDVGTALYLLEEIYNSLWSYDYYICDFNNFRVGVTQIRTGEEMLPLCSDYVE